MSSERYEHAFISYLEKRADDRAMLAALRRGLGQEPGTVPTMYPYVVPFVHSRRDEDNLYTIAALFALHPVSAVDGNMGSHLRQLARQVNDDLDDATTRRFVQLLNQHRGNLDIPLRQHVNLLKANDIAINWHQLLADLFRWDDVERPVQKWWASEYWQR
jgi:CRISPR system Cascade subunit CasB